VLKHRLLRFSNAKKPDLVLGFFSELGMIIRVLIMMVLAGGLFWVYRISKKLTLNQLMQSEQKSGYNRKLADDMPLAAIQSRYSERLPVLRAFAAQQQLHDRYFILVDMRIPSHQARLFLMDAQTNTPLIEALVSHGAGSERGADSLSFSNQVGSYATSLGKYQVGESYQGRFGYSYRLTGLDSTNNKARERAIVVHGYACIPDKQRIEEPLCMSLGCPAVAPAVLERLRPYLDAPEKPILLDIYY
jgi:hypothetical protein